MFAISISPVPGIQQVLNKCGSAQISDTWGKYLMWGVSVGSWGAPGIGWLPEGVRAQGADCVWPLQAIMLRLTLGPHCALQLCVDGNIHSGKGCGGQGRGF